LDRRVLAGGVHADAGLAQGDHGDPARSAGVVLGQQPGPVALLEAASTPTELALKPRTP
jgi:hypothetical protein